MRCWVLIIMSVFLAACEQSSRLTGETEGMRVADVIGEDDPGYLRAYAPRAFNFPLDHGPHPGFKTEWWYLTGNLETADKRHFGYQFTLFRFALTPKAQVRTSTWAANDIYMAHFALTDTENEKFYSFERFSRGAAGLAGAQAVPFRVWLEDWQLRSDQSAFFPLRLNVAQDELHLDLSLSSDKPVVLQGERGWSEKSGGAGNASFYYSYTRLLTRGVVGISGETFSISGASWLDREWSTSALGAEQEGWDWFALQLSDGRELMFYQLRLKTGEADSFSKGVLVFEDGSSVLLKASDVILSPRAHWTSEKTGVSYPTHWRLSLPKFELELDVEPVLAQQEMRLSVRYWEGAISVRGIAAGEPITGRGYLELAGYE